MEAAMSGILDKFHVEHGAQGARILARARELTAHCKTDSDIDAAAAMLKDDLDACAKEMKRLVELNGRGALFEGWPKAGDLVDV